MIHIAYNLWIIFDELCLILVGKDDKLKNQMDWIFIYGASRRLKDWLFLNKIRIENAKNIM